MYNRAQRLVTLAVAGAILSAACFGGTPAAAPSGAAQAAAQVSTGSNVTAQVAVPGLAKPATITFGSVSAAGEVKVEQSVNPPKAPDGVTFKSAKAFEITSTVKFDKATVCLEDASLTSETKLLHYKDGKWNNVTTNTSAGKICGEATSFSPFMTATVECPNGNNFTATQIQAFFDVWARLGCTVTAAASPSPSPTPSPTATATPTPTATATAAATATATATVVATPLRTATPVPTVTATPVPTATPTATPVPTPTPAPDIARPSVPSSGLVIHGRVTDPTGKGIGGACITLGPPIRCWTQTSRSAANPANDGYFMINLGELAAQSGGQWDFYVLVRNYTAYTYANYYSGVFVVDGVEEKNVRFQ